MRRIKRAKHTQKGSRGKYYQCKYIGINRSVKQNTIEISRAKHTNQEKYDEDQKSKTYSESQSRKICSVQNTSESIGRSSKIRSKSAEQNTAITGNTTRIKRAKHTQKASQRKILSVGQAKYARKSAERNPVDLPRQCETDQNATERKKTRALKRETNCAALQEFLGLGFGSGSGLGLGLGLGLGFESGTA
jgi:hypothetical protein